MHECNGVMIMYCVVVVITTHLKNANKRTSGLYSNSNCCIGIGNTTNLTSTKEANTAYHVSSNVTYDQEIEDQNSITKAMNTWL